MSLAPRSWISTLAVVVTACGGDAPAVESVSPINKPAASASTADAGTSVPAPPPLEILDLEILDFEIVANPNNVLSFHAQWSTTELVITEIVVRCGDDYQTTITTDGSRTEHAVFVMGLVPDTRCDVAARANLPDRDLVESTLVHVVPPVPDFLPPLRVDARDPALLASGFTLFNLNNPFGGVPLIVVMVDDAGRYRWYHRVATTMSGEDNDVRVVDQGLLIGGVVTGIAPRLVDWVGTIVWLGDFQMHHDVQFVGPGLLLTMYATDDCPFRAQTLIEHDMTSGETRQFWSICDHYVPPEYRPDWAHMNDVEVMPDGAYLVSVRDQDALLKVDRTTGEVLWNLGRFGDFRLDSGGWFFRQHAPEIQPDGSILLFDNGLWTDRAWSRAAQYSLDQSARTANLVWQYRPDPDIFSPVWGDADRLENGNTLITVGQRDDWQESFLIETNPEGTREVWRLVLPPGWGTYRAERVVDPPLGFVVTGD